MGERPLSVEPGSRLSGALGSRGWKAQTSISQLWPLCLAKLHSFAQDSVVRLTQHPKEESLTSSSFLATAGSSLEEGHLFPQEDWEHGKLKTV